jgi:hypothetical protein
VNVTVSPSRTRAGTATDEHPDRPSSTPTSTGSTTPATRPAAGFLSSKGGVDPNSVATWSQQNVTITTTEPVDSLTVTIKVAMTARVAEAGRYTTVPNNDVIVTVDRGANWMTYKYSLRKGAELIPGNYLFAAQYTHHSGRGMSKDSYTINARAGGQQTDMSGNFS